MAGNNDNDEQHPGGPAAVVPENQSGAGGPGFKLVPQAGPVPETYADGALGAVVAEAKRDHLVKDQNRAAGVAGLARRSQELGAGKD